MAVKTPPKELPALVILITFTLSLILWWFLLRGKVPATTDMVMFSYPDKCVNLEAVQKGFIPLWNPYNDCGLPHLANWVSAFFYPFFWIWSLTGLSSGWIPLCLLHQVFAMAGFYLWMKSEKIHP